MSVDRLHSCDQSEGMYSMGASEDGAHDRHDPEHFDNQQTMYTLMKLFPTGRPVRKRPQEAEFGDNWKTGDKE